MENHAYSRTGTAEGEGLTVGQWVARYPQSARVFESRGIDYCCGGKRSLEEACGRKGLDAAALRAELAELLRGSPPASATDWDQVSLAALVDHIESTHHRFIRTEKPRLTSLAQKVARVHGSRHPELVALAVAVDRIFLELDQHLEREERVYFPACRKWEQGGAGTVSDPDLIAGLDGLEEEHLEVGGILETIRTLTAGFEPPQDACNSYLALFHGLEQFEADLHEHIHKENNILHARIAVSIPNAARLEAKIDLGGTEKRGTAPGSCCEA